MQQVLLLFAHPKFELSRVNRALIDKVKGKEGVTVHDLYERYPDFNVDVPLEKHLLTEHDVILWHHPFYWYSAPPLLKQWIDLVLEFGWAYGPEGTALQGKQAMNVLTAGGTREVYCGEGKNQYSINEFLRPFEQTARLCGMDYLPPFTVMGTNQLSGEELDRCAKQFESFIDILQQGVSIKDIGRCDYFNDIPQLTF